MDKKLEKWLKWMDIIHEEIRALYIHQQVFKNLQEIAQNNHALHKPNILYNYLNDSYVAYIIMGIRRLSKGCDKNEVSLYRLLSELALAPETLSRDHYVSFHADTTLKGYANSYFDRHCNSHGDKHISKEKVEKDRQELQKIYDCISDIADKRIAHHDKRELKHLPTHNDIDDYINKIYKLYKKYHLLLYGEELLTVQFSNEWKKILKIPWIDQ